MNKTTVKEAQAYLTVRHEDRNKKIINIKRLLKKHPIDNILEVLRTYFHEQAKTLQNLVSEDKTNPVINEIIATMFRIKMAISLLEREVHP
jgi:hypothetical protein